MDEEELYDDDILFEKRFQYSPLDGLCVSSDEFLAQLFKSRHWIHSSLQEMKAQSLEVKNQLSSIDITQWHQHTTRTHPGGLVVNYIRNKMAPELCTQAWCKFREIIGNFGLGIDHSQKTFASLHLCEAPGGFVCCLNHFIKDQGYSLAWEWTGSTLNPYYEGNSMAEMVDNDEFIYETLDHWFFGSDNTGNIMRSTMVEDITKKIKTTNADEKVHFVTADGSVDCANNPSEQELMTSRLHYCEVVAAMHVLKTGGQLVLKMFTMYEACSVSLMYLLHCSFGELNVYKPLTSKPGNSEVYVVAKFFKGAPDKLLNVLREHMDEEIYKEKVIFGKEAIPPGFMSMHEECCQLFTAWQTGTIRRNLKLFERANHFKFVFDKIKALRHECMKEYIRIYNVKPLSPDDRLIKPNQKSSSNVAHPHKRYIHRGSFAYRQQQSNMAWSDRVRQMILKPEHHSPETLWIRNPGTLTEAKVLKWKPTTGKPLSHMKSSRFCYKSLLHEYNEMLQNVQCSMCGIYDQYASFLKTSVISILEVFREHWRQSCTAEVVSSQHDRLGTAFRESLEQVKGKDCYRPSRIVVNDNFNPETKELEWCISDDAQCQFFRNLQHIQEGDSLVMTLPPILTRTNAGLVYMAHHSFQKVTVHVPNKASFPICFLLGINYQRLPPSVHSYLQNVMSHTVADGGQGTTDMVQCPDTNKTYTLLSVIPIQQLYDPDLGHLLHHTNQSLITKRINFLLQLEKQFIENRTESQ